MRIVEAIKFVPISLILECWFVARYVPYPCVSACVPPAHDKATSLSLDEDKHGTAIARDGESKWFDRCLVHFRNSCRMFSL